MRYFCQSGFLDSSNFTYPEKFTNVFVRATLPLKLVITATITKIIIVATKQVFQLNTNQSLSEIYRL